MLHIIEGASISTISPASALISRGVRRGASRVEKAVIVTDMATLAFAMKANPLGEEPTNTSPAAMPAGRPKAWVSRHVMGWTCHFIVFLPKEEAVAANIAALPSGYYGIFLSIFSPGRGSRPSRRNHPNRSFT